MLHDSFDISNGDRQRTLGAPHTGRYSRLRRAGLLIYSAHYFGRRAGQASGTKKLATSRSAGLNGIQ